MLRWHPTTSARALAFTLLFIIVAGGCRSDVDDGSGPGAGESAKEDENPDDPTDREASPEQAANPPAESSSLSGPLTAAQLKAFHDACFNGVEARVKWMIDRGVDVNAIDEEHRTALMLAAFNGHTEVCRMLIDKGARVNERNRIGRNALMFAASGPNLSAVKLLLDHGAEVNVTDGDEHWTALMFAAAEGHADIVAVLLKHKADPQLKDIDGDTAEDFARDKGHTNVLRYLSQGPVRDQRP